ncbi:MAG: FecR domain-containing protein [Halobacteriovoraceae bacterium]|nr:FecR domain-containing protein [Halobacteriovoraceae bacterium]
MKKILFALLFALVGIGLSYYFFALKLDLPGREASEKKSIALVGGLYGDTTFRKKDQQLWLPLDLGQELFEGDFVKTGEKSNMTINFPEQESSFDLDEQTLIQIDQQNSEIDLLDGEVYLNPGKGQQMTVKLKGKTLKLLDAKVNLKANPEGEAIIEVFEGEVQTEEGKMLEKGSLSHLSSEGIKSQNFYFNEVSPMHKASLLQEDNELNEVSWGKPLESGESVSLKWGKDPLHLDQTLLLEAEVEGKRAFITWPKGKIFWQLESSLGRKSMVHELFVHKLNPPKILTPKMGESLSPDELSQQVGIAWSLDNSFDLLELQVAEDKDFNNIIERINLPLDLSFKKINLIEGEYFLRLKAVLGDRNPLYSEVHPFKVRELRFPFAPHLKFPSLGQILLTPRDEDELKLDLSWENLPRIEAYKIEIDHQGKITEHRAIGESKINLTLPIAEYRWRVSSIAESKQSDWSDWSHFTIAKPGSIAFQGVRASYSFVDRPNEIKLSWENMADVDNWIAGIENDRGDLVLKQNIQEPSVRFLPPKEGNYYLIVEGLKGDDLLVQSKSQAFKVFQLAFLNAPNFQEQMPNPLIADRNGSVLIVLELLRGAKAYHLNIVNEKGNSVYSRSNTKPNFRVYNLPSGSYTVEARSIDQYDRQSPKFTGRKLIVPQREKLKAPSVKKIEVH